MESKAFNKCQSRAIQGGSETFSTNAKDGVKSDRATLFPVLTACASLGLIEEGRRIHALITKNGFECDRYVVSSLVDMYAKCGSIEEAWSVFNRIPKHDVVSWTAMIVGYVKCGEGQKALELSQKMQAQGIAPNHVTFVAMLNACASVMALEEGRNIHRKIIEQGYDSNIFICNSLVDMYAKCGSIEEAFTVFNKMPTHDAVSWSSMILGFVKCGKGHKAFELSQQMQREIVDVDCMTYVGMLSACASVAALEEGKHVHEKIIKEGHESDAFISSSLIDMYVKCGSLKDALKVFDNVDKCDLVTWNALLGGYAMHGHGNEALWHFQKMNQAGVAVNAVTLVCLLSACSHGGLVGEGLHLFESMSTVYGISPTIEHYSCIVDLLGRAGHLQEALDVIEMMSCQPTPAVWTSLLGSCRIHGNLDMGELVSKHVMKLDSENVASFVLLSNIFATAAWEERTNSEQQRLEMKVNEPGCSYIELNNKIHSFIKNDSIHPQIGEIHSELDRLSGKIERRYLPDTRNELRKGGGEHKVFQLSHHSEMLAIALGLINTPVKTSLRIVNNQQVCEDCHVAIKLISKLVERTIFLRDTRALSPL